MFFCCLVWWRNPCIWSLRLAQFLYSHLRPPEKNIHNKDKVKKLFSSSSASLEEEDLVVLLPGLIIRASSHWLRRNVKKKLSIVKISLVKEKGFYCFEGWRRTHCVFPAYNSLSFLVNEEECSEKLSIVRRRMLRKTLHCKYKVRGVFFCPVCGRPCSASSCPYSSRPLTKDR